MPASTATSPIQDRLFVLDLDRCLINEAVYELFKTKVTDHIKGIDITARKEAQAQVEASGGSFDESAWLLQQEGVDEGSYSRLLNDFIARAHAMGQDHFLNPGAKDLLKTLSSSKISHLIMTYGGKLNQIAKLKATQLDSIDFIVAENKHKAHHILSWWDELDQIYSVPIGKSVIAATSIVLVGDKAGAFDGLPKKSAKGYWLKSEHLLPSQLGTVDQNVTPISSLSEIISLEHLV